MSHKKMTRKDHNLKARSFFEETFLGFKSFFPRFLGFNVQDRPDTKRLRRKST